MVVVTWSGVLREGGRVMEGKTGCTGDVGGVSLIRAEMRELLPVASSPTTHIRTGGRHQALVRGPV